MLMMRVDKTKNVTGQEIKTELRVKNIVVGEAMKANAKDSMLAYQEVCPESPTCSRFEYVAPRLCRYLRPSTL
jgi:hypothetical protein